MAKLVGLQTSPDCFAINSRAAQREANSISGLRFYNQHCQSFSQAVHQKARGNTSNLLHVSESGLRHIKKQSTRALAWQRPEPLHNSSAEQEDAHRVGLRGYQRPVSLGELKRRKEAQHTSTGSSNVKQTISKRPHVDEHNSCSDDSGAKLGAREWPTNSTRSGQYASTGFEDRTKAISAQDHVVERFKHNEVFLTEVSEAIVQSGDRPTHPAVDVRGHDPLARADKSTKEWQSEAHRTSQSRDVIQEHSSQLNLRPSVQAMPNTGPSARPLTVEEFLRREAVKKREAGIEDGDNTALSALESLEKGSSNFDKTSVEKQNSRKAAYQKFNGPARWKVQYKEEEADELGDPDSSEVEDAKEKAISMLNRR
jgi:hypothetical protein